MLPRPLDCVELCAYFPYGLCCAADVSTVVIGDKITVPAGDRTLFTWLLKSSAKKTQINEMFLFSFNQDLFYTPFSIEPFKFNLVVRANRIFFKYLLHPSVKDSRPGLNTPPGGYCANAGVSSIWRQVAGSSRVTTGRTTQLSYHCGRVLFILCGKGGRWPSACLITSISYSKSLSYVRYTTKVQ